MVNRIASPNHGTQDQGRHVPEGVGLSPVAQSFAFAIVNLHDWSQAINAPTLV